MRRPIVPVARTINSRKRARAVTSAFHRITHELERATDRAERRHLTDELRRLGGRAAYQQASAFNTAVNSTSRWVVRRIRARNMLPPAAPHEPRLLEIGAINAQLLDTPGLCVRAIDLRASLPRIERADFLALPHGGQPSASTGVTRAYDVLVCSMVLNCVPEARARFDMLVGMRAHLVVGGVCFIVLPLSCLVHSHTLTATSFADCLRAVGLRPEEETPKPASQKLIYFECVAGAPDRAAALRFQASRHERRAQGRKSAGADARARRKSQGATFDIDLGGNLGFGVRVPRSFEPSIIGRARRVQEAARDEFLRRCDEAKTTAEEPTSGDGRVSEGGAPSEPLAADHVETHPALARLVHELGLDSETHLDFASWSWGPSSGCSDACRWSLHSRAASLQSTTGWHWRRAGGWERRSPRPARAMTATRACTTEQRWSGERHVPIRSLPSSFRCWWRCGSDFI